MTEEAQGPASSSQCQPSYVLPAPPTPPCLSSPHPHHPLAPTQVSAYHPTSLSCSGMTAVKSLLFSGIRSQRTRRPCQIQPQPHLLFRRLPAAALPRGLPRGECWKGVSSVLWLASPSPGFFSLWGKVFLLGPEDARVRTELMIPCPLTLDFLLCF